MRILAVATLALCSAASAQDLFQITVSDTGPGPITSATASASNLLDLIEQVVESRGAFAFFENRDTTATLRYGNVEDAILITKNSSNTRATLEFPGTGFTRTFTGANEDELQNDIEDFLRQDGTAEVREFLQDMNARSFIAVSDGNPASTTARIAQYAFERYGMFDNLSRPAITTLGTREKAGYEIRIDGAASTISPGDFSGESAWLAVSSQYDWTRRVGTVIALQGVYTTIEDADVFHVAAHLGVPIRIFLPSDRTPISWQLTPGIVAAGSGSEDIASGGLVLGAGLTSLVQYELDRWSFGIVNQITFYEGEQLEFEDFQIDPGVSQSVLKNGVRAEYRFADTWYAAAGLSLSNYLEDAAVDAWITPQIGIGWKLRGGSGGYLGYTGDFGDDWHSHGLRAGLNIAF